MVRYRLCWTAFGSTGPGHGAWHDKTEFPVLLRKLQILNDLFGTAVFWIESIPVCLVPLFEREGVYA